MSSKVYFTDFRCPVGTSRIDKIKMLCKAAGIDKIDFDGKFTAIKMHFGELGNLAFLRPNYAKAIADIVKEKGGKPSSPTAIPYTQEAVKTRLTIWIAQNSMALTPSQPAAM